MAEFIAGKDQCLKFINQDLTFLQPLVILPTSRNTVENDNSPAQTSQLDSQVTSLAAVNLPTPVTKPKNSTPPTQTVELVLGFTPAEICRADKEPKLTIKQLLALSSCKGYVQMPLQMLDGIYVVPPQSWHDQGDTKHSKCLLLGGRRLNQMTLIPKPNGSGGARAATAQVGPANKRNDTKRCLPTEASLRPGEAVPW